VLREYGDLRIAIEDGVATIGMLPSGDAQYRRMREAEGKVKKFFPKHKEVGEAIEELRGDNDVRVIVLTGLGDMFFIPPSSGPGIQAHDPGEDWDLTQGLARTFNAIIECEKPIVARVNGAAVAYGSSLVFACDFVVADEEAMIADYHLGMGELPFGRADFGVVPGDGGSVFVPMQMTLAHARDFLLLARPFTGRELADLGYIHKAVPRDQLDGAVKELCDRLLKRTPYALAWSKRVLNRRIAQQFALTFDAAWAYEMVNFYMEHAARSERGKTRL
jgi:enoyl-CoA hydratase